MGGDVMEEIPNHPGRHQEELVKFFEMSLDMLCIADFSGHFTRINAAWEATLGHTTAELCAVPYVDFTHPDDRASTLAEAARLKVGVDTVLFENRYRCRDGSYIGCAGARMRTSRPGSSTPSRATSRRGSVQRTR